jgi:hypothetical protein
LRATAAAGRKQASLEKTFLLRKAFCLFILKRGCNIAREIQAAETRVNQAGCQEIVHISNLKDIWAFDLIVEKKMRDGTAR